MHDFSVSSRSYCSSVSVVATATLGRRVPGTGDVNATVTFPAKADFQEFVAWVKTIHVLSGGELGTSIYACVRYRVLMVVQDAYCSILCTLSLRVPSVRDRDHPTAGPSLFCNGNTVVVQ